MAKKTPEPDLSEVLPEGLSASELFTAFCKEGGAEDALYEFFKDGSADNQLLQLIDTGETEDDGFEEEEGENAELLIEVFREFLEAKLRDKRATKKKS